MKLYNAHHSGNSVRNGPNGAFISAQLLVQLTTTVIKAKLKCPARYTLWRGLQTEISEIRGVVLHISIVKLLPCLCQLYTCHVRLESLSGFVRLISRYTSGQFAQAEFIFWGIHVVLAPTSEVRLWGIKHLWNDIYSKGDIKDVHACFTKSIYEVSKSSECLWSVSHSNTVLYSWVEEACHQMQLHWTVTRVFLTRLHLEDVGQGSRSRTPYSCPLPQLQGIPAIPTHPSLRNFWHVVNVGSPQLCWDAHMCTVLVSLDP